MCHMLEHTRLLVPWALRHRRSHAWLLISLAWRRWMPGWQQMLLPQPVGLKIKLKRHIKGLQIISSHLKDKCWCIYAKPSCSYTCVFIRFQIYILSGCLGSGWVPAHCPVQTKTKLKKFLEAMIQKSGKIRSLIRDIDEHYSLSQPMQKPCPHYTLVDVQCSHIGFYILFSYLYIYGYDL